MKRRAMTAAFLAAALAAPAAAFHVGLGNAVASQGAKVTDKAASPLPSCGGRFTLFNLFPVNDPSLVAITPLGHNFPPGHTFPADHMYFNFNESTSAQMGINLYAPSDGWVVQTTRNEYNGGGPLPGVDQDYFLAFSPCQEVKLNFLHVVSVAPEIANPAGPTSSQCTPFSSGGENGSNCVTTMQVAVKQGQVLGTGLISDFGPLEDTRVQLQGFVNPSRHDLNRGFCPVNYFVPSVQAAMNALLGVNNGASLTPRVIAPTCGTIVQDVAGTVQGDWYFPGAPNMPEDPHMALIHDNVFASTAVFSLGSSFPNVPTNVYDVFPKTVADGTRIDYDFNLVADSQTYCYDNFVDLFEGTGGHSADPTLAGHIAVLQMDASLQDLTIEFQNPGTGCAAAAPWSFGANAVHFLR